MSANKKITPVAILLLVLLVVSVVANFLLYSMWTVTVESNASLEEDVASLELSNDQLETQVNNLENQVADLEWWKSFLENETTELRAADLEVIDSGWYDNHPPLGSPYVNVYGTVVNFGDETAYEVVLTAKIYEGAVVLKSEDIPLEDIIGEWYGKFDVDVEYSGDADWVETSVSYT